MPPSGTPQVIHSQTSSLAQVLVEFHFNTLKKNPKKTHTQHWDVTLAMPHHQIAMCKANSSNQSRVVMLALRGFSVNGCVSYQKINLYICIVVFVIPFFLSRYTCTAFRNTFNLNWSVSFWASHSLCWYACTVCGIITRSTQM